MHACPDCSNTGLSTTLKKFPLVPCLHEREIASVCSMREGAPGGGGEGEGRGGGGERDPQSL